jgi:hypothetical protein
MPAGTRRRGNDRSGEQDGRPSALRVAVFGAEVPSTEAAGKHLHRGAPLCTFVTLDPRTGTRHTDAPPDLEALEKFLLRLGRLLADHLSIEEITIPALSVGGQGVMAREARAVLEEPEAE